VISISLKFSMMCRACNKVCKMRQTVLKETCHIADIKLCRWDFFSSCRHHYREKLNHTSWKLGWTLCIVDNSHTGSDACCLANSSFYLMLNYVDYFLSVKSITLLSCSLNWYLKSSPKLRSYIVTWIEFVKKIQLSATKFCNEVVQVC